MTRNQTNYAIGTKHDAVQIITAQLQKYVDMRNNLEETLRVSRLAIPDEAERDLIYFDQTIVAYQYVKQLVEKDVNLHIAAAERARQRRRKKHPPYPPTSMDTDRKGESPLQPPPSESTIPLT